MEGIEIAGRSDPLGRRRFLTAMGAVAGGTLLATLPDSAAAAGGKTLLTVGDSITAAVEPGSVAWRDQLPYAYVDLSVPGRPAAHRSWVPRIQAAVRRAERIDGVVVFLGSNDVRVGTSVEAYRRALRRIVAQTRQPTVLCTIAFRARGDWDEELHRRELNQVVREEAARTSRWTVAEVDLDPWETRDGVHPTEPGAKRLASTIGDALNRIGL